MVCSCQAPCWRSVNRVLGGGGLHTKGVMRWETVLAGGFTEGAQIRANRWHCADSRKSGDSRESLEGSRTEPPFCESCFGALKGCESQVWDDSRESLESYENRFVDFFFFCELIRANHPDSRCESPGHLSTEGAWKVLGRQKTRPFAEYGALCEHTKSLCQALVSV